MTTKKQLAATPVLKPDTYTADDVLAWLETVIAEEPKRMRMASWFTFVKGRVWPHVIDPSRARQIERPACGTAACAAGWILLGTRRVSSVSNAFGGSSLALEALGLDWQHTTYEAGACGALYKLFMAVSKTPENVLEALSEIRTIHREELRAATVTVPARRKA